ncbi:MAG: hypothetical protein ACRDLL_03390 [Solirubrobacterales bacterium]
MAQFAIRCLPRVPVASDELERWLERELEDLRRDMPHGTIRLSRLTESLPDTDISIGWLIEFDLPGRRPQLDRGRLAAVLRDLRLLGFQPTVLAPPDGTELPTSGRATRQASSLGMETAV